MKVVSDSSPLIFMSKLHVLFLLEELYREVIITRAVYEEVVVKGLKIYEDASHVNPLLRALV